MSYRDRALSQSDAYNMPPLRSKSSFPWWARSLSLVALAALFGLCCWALSLLGQSFLIWPVLLLMVVIGGLAKACLEA